MRPGSESESGRIITIETSLAVSSRELTGQDRTLGQKDPLEMRTATHFSILAWETPCTEEPGGLQTMELQRVGIHT